MCSSDLAGLDSLEDAVITCGALRIGHGVRIMDDIAPAADGSATLGRFARWVLDRRIPLECCPTSNLDTGAVTTIEEHPIGRLRDLGFVVTVNTDDRLMSDVTLGGELALVARTFGLGIDAVRDLTVAAMESAFAPDEERRRIVREVIAPGYAALGAGMSAG